jgi:hypothetical protein
MCLVSQLFLSHYSEVCTYHGFSNDTTLGMIYSNLAGLSLYVVMQPKNWPTVAVHIGDKLGGLLSRISSIYYQIFLTQEVHKV